MNTDVCEACQDKGWLEVLVDYYEAPPGMVFVQRCDLCGMYDSDWKAALAREKSTGRSPLAILCRRHGDTGLEREIDPQIPAKGTV